MNKLGNFFKPLTWLALLLAGLVAGCGSDDGDGVLPVPPTPPGQAAGAVCTSGAACVNLGTAGDFVILAQAAISSVPTSAVTGNVGLASGAGITGLTCPEVSVGRVFNSDATFADQSCVTIDGAKITLAETDTGLAFVNASDTVAHPQTGLNPDPTAGPIAAGVYDFGGGITIDTPVTLSGSATDVWIFRVPGDVNQTTGNVTLTGGALPQNVFWRVTGNVSIGAGGQFAGIVLADGTINMAGGGAAVNGRLYSASDVTLSAGGNTVTRPQ